MDRTADISGALSARSPGGLANLHPRAASVHGVILDRVRRVPWAASGPMLRSSSRTWDESFVAQIRSVRRKRVSLNAYRIAAGSSLEDPEEVSSGGVMSAVGGGHSADEGASEWCHQLSRSLSPRPLP